MKFSEDQISAIIGAKELELIALRHALAQTNAELEKLKKAGEKPAEEPAP